MFGLAILLWLFVMLRKEYDQELGVPVRVVHLKENKILMEVPPGRVETLFHGRGTTLILLSLFGRARIDLNLDKVQYSHAFPLRPDMVKWAPGIDADVVEIVFPDTIIIHLDDVISRNLAVKPLITISKDQDFSLTRPLRCDPESVRVQGPKSLVNGLSFIPTQARALDHVNSDINLKLDLISPADKKITVKPTTVKVTASVEKLIQREITEIPIHVIHCLPDKPGFSEPDQINLTLRGSKAAIENLKRSDLFVTVNVQNQPDVNENYIPAVNLPDEIQLVEMNPPSVTIIFRTSSASDSDGSP